MQSSYVNPIPVLSTWVAKMLTLGKKWAAWLDANPTAVLWEGGPEYYDGGRVYEQIASYTHDPTWLKYADIIHVAYADSIINLNGGLQGYNVFARGLLMGWQRTKNPKYLQALNVLAYGKSAATAYLSELRYFRQHGSPVSASAPGLNPAWHQEYIREAAYIASAMICNEIVSGKRHPLLLTGVYDCIVPDLDAFMSPTGATYLGKTVVNTYGVRTTGYVNNFMIGLALETLIEYYDLTGDAQIPPIVKTVLDFFWDYCVEQPASLLPKVNPKVKTPVPASYAMYYNSDPVSGLDTVRDPKGIGVVNTASDLNQLVSPAYAWYGLHFDKSYWTKADELFQAGVLGAGTNCPLSKICQDYTFSGKEFSQNYKWSFDYVKWRNSGLNGGVGNGRT